ncbi:unnamed protein product [Adineta steineri]|uniref:Prohormone-4 n=1 Tax=Adineta steineri TaxID=433720 RepID=A0A816CTD7_9BILA|nr:unnamed protein product [Adineta steineri]CAF1628405.1 unnamed protein product [Adineta steineri]
MMTPIPSLFAILISSLVIITDINANDGHQQEWLANPHHNRVHLFKKWLANKAIDARAASSPYDVLHPTHQFKGCIDPSEPFQCPQSERCIALQFICDGNPGDCPGNTDENEETCIAAKRPAKENIEKFLLAEYQLHGSKLFTFLFGDKISKSIEENNAYWFDILASAFSVAKTITSFAEKTQMSSDDLAHFQNVVQMIHDGRLEEIPVYGQEAVTQGLGSLIEKLYDSGFMDH